MYLHAPRLSLFRSGIISRVCRVCLSECAEDIFLDGIRYSFLLNIVRDFLDSSDAWLVLPSTTSWQPGSSSAVASSCTHVRIRFGTERQLGEFPFSLIFVEGT